MHAPAPTSRSGDFRPDGSMHLTTLHAHLLSEIDGRMFRPLLQEITRTNAAFAAYPTWGAVATALNANHLSVADEDALLTPLVLAYARTAEERWATILCGVSFRWLVASHARRARWHDDADEVWQELMVAFLDVCRRVAKRGQIGRIRHQVLCQTQHRLHDACARRWRLEAPEVVTAGAELPERSDPREEPRRRDARLDLRDLQERGTAQYHQQQAAGIIDTLDVAILVGTRLHGRTVAEEAARLGIGVECAKKRRQRAEAALRTVGSLIPGSTAGDATLDVPRSSVP